MIFVGCDVFLSLLTISWIFAYPESTVQVYRCKFVIDVENITESPDGVGLAAQVNDF